jgi:hypothetical protein
VVINHGWFGTDHAPNQCDEFAIASPTAGVTAENYWDRIAECVALAKTAPTNELRARHFAAAHRYLQLAEAQASSAAKPVPK